MAPLLLLLLLAALPSTSADEAAVWAPMPNGRTMHTSCIHQYHEPFELLHHQDGTSTVSFVSGRASETHPPCPHASAATAIQSGGNLGYYSSWVAYVQNVRAGLSSMTSTWTVPEKPASRGPAPPLIASSVYIFNGVEDGGGVPGASSVILQPVLQYGKSGCLLNPLKLSDWYLTSYAVNGAGRAYCGPNLGPLAVGEELVGNMTLLDQVENQWEVLSTRQKDGSVSKITTSLGNATAVDTAYLTLEMMVVYNCDAYPANGNVTFGTTELRVRHEERDGSVTPEWSTRLKKTECAQSVAHDRGAGPVTISWDPAKK